METRCRFILHATPTHHIYILGYKTSYDFKYALSELLNSTWFKLRLIIMISRSAGWLLKAVDRYWDTRTVEFDLSRALFLY